MEEQQGWYKYIGQYLSRSKCVELTQEDFKKAEDYAIKKSKAKYGEAEYKGNSSCMYKRNITGQLGEVAVGKYLNYDFTDWTIGNSSNFRKPDIEKLWCGVKTAEYGNFPLVNKIQHRWPEVICILSEDKHKCYILGIATTYQLDTFTDEKLVKLEEARKTKTGFYQCGRLTPFNSTDDIKRFVKIDKGVRRF